MKKMNVPTRPQHVPPKMTLKLYVSIQSFSKANIILHMSSNARMEQTGISQSAAVNMVSKL